MGNTLGATLDRKLAPALDDATRVAFLPLQRVRPPLRVHRPFTGQSPFANGAHEPGLAAERLINGLFGHTGLGGDRGDRGRLESGGPKEAFGGIDDGRSRVKSTSAAIRRIVATSTLDGSRFRRHGAKYQIQYTVSD